MSGMDGNKGQSHRGKPAIRMISIMANWVDLKCALLTARLCRRSRMLHCKFKPPQEVRSNEWNSQNHHEDPPAHSHLHNSM